MGETSCSGISGSCQRCGAGDRLFTFRVEKLHSPAIAVIIVAVCFLSLYASTMIPRLPADESGLDILLEEMLIDTFQFEQLLVFYALPLSVPQGELALLAEVFPEIGEMLPETEVLEVYQPFDNRGVRRLFNDFPILADLEPILRCNTAQAERGAVNGEIIFGINRSNINELRGHRMRMRVKSDAVSVEGSVALSDTGAMWQNRRVDISRAGVNAQLGNFKQPVPGELFFGRFSPLPADRRGVAENWLYGGSNTWNGAAINKTKIPGAEMLGASAFCHIRGDERAAGGTVDWDIGHGMRIFAGISGFQTVERIGDSGNISGNDDIDDDSNIDDNYNNDSSYTKEYIYTYTAHLYGEYRMNAWRAVLETGLPLGQGGITPALSFRLSYRLRETSAEYHFLGYPNEFTAPMSRIKRQLLSEIGERESPQSPAIQKHRLRMTVPLSIPKVNTARFVPEIDFTECLGTVRRVQGRAEIRARVPKADITLRHTARIFTMGVDSVLHTSTASLNLRTDYPVEIRATAQSVYGYYANSRNTYTLETRYTGAQNVLIAPFVRGRYIQNHEYWLGLKTELHLYKKTWTALTAELPFNVKGADNVYIRGSASYNF
ncbi:MAG: hypothetical protein LBC70_02090 [Chitinispirillales bacterium]|jgi:hypothetical protein|nr:hypothetical protein [Chitinispirillales bacterium]